MPIPVAVAVELSDDERARLESWARRRSSAQALALRARIVLLAAEGLKNTEIAERLEIEHRLFGEVWPTGERQLDQHGFGSGESAALAIRKTCWEIGRELDLVSELDRDHRTV